MIRFAPALVAGFFMAAPASALVLNIPLPPAQYDKPYRGKLTIIEKDVADVHAACGSPLGIRAFACAMPNGGGCTIILPRIGGVTKQQYARLKRHEIGHCNGWPGHHPNPVWD